MPAALTIDNSEVESLKRRRGGPVDGARSSLKVKGTLNGFACSMANPATALDENEKWEALWYRLLPKK